MSGRRALNALPRLPSQLLAAYYNGPDHPAKIRIFTAVMARLGQPRLTIRYAGRGWLTVDLADLVARSILTTGAYEPEVWEALLPFVEPGAVVWDAGGHIGSFAVRALLDARVQSVHVFEPDPRLASIIRHHLALNGGRGTLHQYALLQEDGRVHFEAAPAANRGIGRVTASGALEVEGRSVDSLVFSRGLKPPTLMKIDVEGSETAVLQGALRTLREQPPRAIVIELDWDEAADRPDPDNEAVALLLHNHYRLQHIKRPAGHRESRENVLAVREQ